MEYSKLQIGCMLIVLYVSFIYIRERHAYRIRQKDWLFELLLGVGIASIAFDGITAYTVNHLMQIPALANAFFHLCFLGSLDAIVFLMFLYILDITREIPKKHSLRLLITFPFLASIAVVILFLPQLEYRHGSITNYSMGVSAYTCYFMIAVYMFATVVVLVTGWKNMDHHKLVTISTCVGVSIAVTIYQAIHPQALLSCLVPTFVILGTYLNMENPLFTKLQAHNQEMVMGFATLVENKDGSTGGHIRRSTTYVKMLAKELWARGYYKDELTAEYVKNLVMAAPMHDIGKIAIPDAILQKPGKLTDEEFAIMKTHAEKGGQIIKETFGDAGDELYGKIVYEVARYHHEKWNGNGYPQGLSHEQIPLCARIMAIADVFDAVSAKRCYREALPLPTCFQIIEEGSGRDFDPVIAEVFLSIKDQVAKVCEDQSPKSDTSDTSDGGQQPFKNSSMAREK